MKASRIVVIVFALLCGLSGVIAGVFEIMQGNKPTGGLIISIIGPEYSMWDTYDASELMETYSALTIIPNFLLTGILAILVSISVIFWSIYGVHRKWGAWVFLLLSILQFMVGASFVLDMAILTFLVSLLINKPLTWWNRILPKKLKKVLAGLFPTSIVLYIIIAILLLMFTILGADSEDLHKFMEILAGAMLLPIVVMILGSISKDRITG